jgi:hypothetical protein
MSSQQVKKIIKEINTVAFLQCLCQSLCGALKTLDIVVMAFSSAHFVSCVRQLKAVYF